MSKTRYDNKGRVLRKGESQRGQDKRYVYTYVNPWKKRCYIYALTLAELREKEDMLKRNQLDGIAEYEDGTANLNCLVDRYLAMKDGLASSTLSNYRYMYDRFCRETIGKCRLNEIKYSDVLYFYDGLLKQKISVKTLETIHCVLHPAFDMAVRDDVIRRNPSDRIIAEIKKTHKKKVSKQKALTSEQQDRFMNFVSGHPLYDYWRPLFTVLLGTGARIGEVCGLRWQDVDFKTRIIRINHSMTYFKRWDGKKYSCGFECGNTKTEAGMREIPMMDSVYEVLKEEYEKQQKEGFSTIEIDGISGFIFINKAGTIHKHSSIDHSIKRIVNRYNEIELLSAQSEQREPVLLPSFSCHTFRHTFCTRLCEADLNIKVIQDVMGHRDVKTTLDIYTQISTKKRQESLENFAKIFNNINEKV